MFEFKDPKQYYQQQPFSPLHLQIACKDLNHEYLPEDYLQVPVYLQLSLLSQHKHLQLAQVQLKKDLDQSILQVSLLMPIQSWVLYLLLF